MEPGFVDTKFGQRAKLILGILPSKGCPANYPGHYKEKMEGLHYTALVARSENDEMDAGFYLSPDCIGKTKPA